MRALGPITLLACLLAGAGVAAEEATCPPWQPQMVRGLQTRTALGTAIWAGDVALYSKPGLALNFELSYEFFSWLAVEASYVLGFNATSQPAPPQPGDFTTQAALGGLRFSLPLGSFDLFLRGGAGWLWARPNILVRLPKFDGYGHFAWLGGLGFFYHTPRRRVFLGIEATSIGAIDFPGILITTTAVLGVTLL